MFVLVYWTMSRQPWILRCGKWEPVFQFVPFLVLKKTSASILVKEGAYKKVRSENIGQMEKGTFSLKKSVNVKQCMRK